MNLSNAKTKVSHSLSNFFSTGEKIHNNMDIAVRRLVKEEYRSLPLAVCRGQAPSKCTWVKKRHEVSSLSKQRGVWARSSLP